MNAESIPAESTHSTTDHSPAHAVHGRCQLDTPTVTAFCGAVFSRDEEIAEPENVCVVCLDLHRCPICGKNFGA